MDHTTQANALSTMLQNLEEEKKRVLQQYDAKLEIGSLAQQQISKQQALLQVDADIALLETQLLAKRASKQAIQAELTTISFQIPELTKSSHKKCVWISLWYFVDIWDTKTLIIWKLRIIVL